MHAPANPARFQATGPGRHFQPRKAGKSPSTEKIKTATASAVAEIGVLTIREIAPTAKVESAHSSQTRIERILAWAGSRCAQASSCGASKIALSEKSTIKIRSHAGRDHASGDHTMVPNVVTKSRKMWLRIPIA